MSAIALDVIPIFLLIAIGWAAVRTGLLKPDTGDALGDFVFRLAVPVILFRTVAAADFQGISPWGLWAAYFSGVAVTWTVGHLIATRLFGSDDRIGVISGVSCAFSNTVFIGLPLVDRMVGHDGVVALSIVLVVHLPVMMIAGTLMMQRADRLVSGNPGQSVLAVVTHVGRTLVRNPLVVGIAAGILYNVVGFPLEGIARTVVDQVAGLAGPSALIAMGLAMHKYGLRGQVGQASVMAVAKLLLLPAVVFLAARGLDLRPDWTAALVLTAAAPTGVNAYLIANHFGVGHSLASSVTTLTTAVGVATVTLWAIVLGL